MKVFEAEARAGFPRLRGTRVRATVPIDQAMVDGWLRRTPVNAEIQERNRLLVQYGGVRMAAEIVGVTPDLTVVLSTPWWSRAALFGVLVYKPGLQDYLRQQGGLVHIVCGQIPAVARYRYLWRHVSDVQARTERGRVMLDVQIVIA